MKSDVIHINSRGEGANEALMQAEAVASFKALEKKEAIRLRLLAEEMLGMFRELTGEKDADFWIDDADKNFKLHLKTNTRMNSEKRAKLIKSSTKGENAAAKGVMGKLRNIFECALEPADDYMPDYFETGWMYDNISPDGMALVTAELWSLNRYRMSIQNDASHKEEWDELEKSIVASLADEVEISISGDAVEMIIYKKF